MENTPCTLADNQRSNTGGGWTIPTLSNPFSLHVPLSKRLAVGSTDVPCGHLSIGLVTALLIPLWSRLAAYTVSTRGSETFIHQLLITSAPVVELLHEGHIPSDVDFQLSSLPRAKYLRPYL